MTCFQVSVQITEQIAMWTIALIQTIQQVCSSVTQQIQQWQHQFQNQCVQSTSQACNSLPWPLSALCSWVTVEGWIVGTFPFGRKYGLIRSGELIFTFEGGNIVDIQSDRPNLREDLDLAFEAEPGLKSVVECGFGLSRAVTDAAAEIEIGCLWHERNYGLHLGLGAGLREKAGTRTNHHHLDIVVKHGVLSSKDGFVLNW